MITQELPQHPPYSHATALSGLEVKGESCGQEWPTQSAFTPYPFLQSGHVVVRPAGRPFHTVMVGEAGLHPNQQFLIRL